MKKSRANVEWVSTTFQEKLVTFKHTKLCISITMKAIISYNTEKKITFGIGSESKLLAELYCRFDPNLRVPLVSEK